jgi:hypothetical protein
VVELVVELGKKLLIRLFQTSAGNLNSRELASSMKFGLSIIITLGDVFAVVHVKFLWKSIIFITCKADSKFGGNVVQKWCLVNQNVVETAPKHSTSLICFMRSPKMSNLLLHCSGIYNFDQPPLNPRWGTWILW